jgi:hypothetical protein
MEFPDVVKKFNNKKIDISYYLKSIIGFCTRFINYDNRYQPSSESLLKSLRKSKDDKDPDEDEVSNMKDALVQKSAEKWIKGYIKGLHDDSKKDGAIISHLWKEARTYAKNLFDTTYANKAVKYLGNNVYLGNAYYTSFLNSQCSR